MKNRFAVQLNAVMLVIGINCMYSPYPCVISAGIPAIAAEQSTLVRGVTEPSPDLELYFIQADADAKALRSACIACINALGNADAAISSDCVDTGFIGTYEEARNVYEISKDLYLGGAAYSMDYVRLTDGRVHLLLKTEGVTPEQAYEQHLEAKTRLRDIADRIIKPDRTNGDLAAAIYHWVTSHISYTSGAESCSAGKNATAYSAIMNGTATCDGISTMMLALFDDCGIPAAKIQNGRHAYNIAWSNGQWILYDAASGISGNPSELMQRYGDCYTPEVITLGFAAGNVSLCSQ